jgi:hypothetical protein
MEVVEGPSALEVVVTESSVLKDGASVCPVLSTILSLADGLALRPDGPRSGQSAPVGRTVRACAEQFRVPSFVLCLLARFAELARNMLIRGV